MSKNPERESIFENERIFQVIHDCMTTHVREIL